ncbi:MAG: hypothetical protein CMH20_14755, partial [Methylophaga sp.]|nr:hypothetical protein [Methylophaga sp.]
GLFIFHLRLCCELKKRQSRHEERLLVVLNKRRATQSGAFSVTTRRAGTIFAAAFVVNHLCRKTILRAFRLVGHKNSRQQWWI